MTDTWPSFSTVDSFFVSTPLCARRWTAAAKESVNVATRPSGITAITIPSASSTTSLMGICSEKYPTAATIAPTPAAIHAVSLLS
jgi:hypothetical protein